MLLTRKIRRHCFQDIHRISFFMGDSLHADDALLFAAYQRVIMGSMNVPDIPVNSPYKAQSPRENLPSQNSASRCDALILTGEAFRS